MSKHRKPMDPVWMVIIGVLLIVFHAVGKFVAIIAGVIMIILGVRRLIEHHRESKNDETN